MSNKEIISRIVKNAIVAALYFILTLVSTPIAYSNIQFRISEILVLLCFFNRDYVIGITIGCFLSNLLSPFMPWDLLIGTSATLLSCLSISFCKHLAISCVFPILFNSFLVAIEYRFIAEKTLPYFYSVGIIALGESVVIIFGYILFILFFKKENMQKIIGAKRNFDFKW